MPHQGQPCPICDAPTRHSAPCYRVNMLPSDTLPRQTADTLWTCGACGFRWIDPPPDTAALAQAYRDTPAQHWGQAGDAAAIAQPRDYVGKVREITAFVPAGRALDIGCFHGELLAHLPDTFERWGLELSAAAAQVARERGIHVVEGDVLTADLPDAHFDLILSSDVHEHVVDQRALAARLARWVKPGGLVVIETGDAGAPLARLMGPRWYYTGLTEHVCAHTARSLDRVMADAGFTPVARDRRWHDRPRSRARAYARVGMALAFRAVADGLGLAARVAPLPAPLERLHRRWPPWHATRDHLWHIYRRSPA